MKSKVDFYFQRLKRTVGQIDYEKKTSHIFINNGTDG